MPVSEFMNERLVTVTPDDGLDAAVALMEKSGVHHLLVMEQDRIAGILSSADLLKVALLAPRDPMSPAEAGEHFQLRVRDVMQLRVAVLKSNASLKEVARALTLGNFHALPIVAIDGAPVGMVTTSDLATLLLAQIENESTPQAAVKAAPGAHLHDVLRAAQIYLQSGQAEQQHARLVRAVDRAREIEAVA